MMTPRDLLDVLRRLGIRPRIEDGRLQVAAPKGALTRDLDAAIRENRPHLVAILTAEAAYGDLTPGLPLLAPDYEVPDTWRPAPPFTTAEQVVYDDTLREMAEVLEDGDLIRFIGTFGARLYVDEKGALRARDGQKVPAPVRQVVRDRQTTIAQYLIDDKETSCRP